MKQYDAVELIEKIDNYSVGTIGIIIEIYDNNICYLEILDQEGDTIDVLYDVPLCKVKKIQVNN